VTVRVQGAFRGRLASFGEVRELAEAFAVAAGVERAVALRVILVLEELFTNTVTHGYPAGSEGPVWVTLARETGAIEVTYEDQAPAFDPLADAPAPSEQSLVHEERPPGGLGVALVRGLSASARYARVGDRNRVTLTIAAVIPPPSSPTVAPSERAGA
jgi:anti-sigma regulatory factor (Ser/Thr protein kinase)